jgi:hypothetical protein
LNKKTLLSYNNKFLQREKEAETARRVFFHPNGIDVCGLYFIVFAAILIYSSARFCVRSPQSSNFFILSEAVAAALEN